MERLVSCGNHYGVATALADVFNSVKVVSDFEVKELGFEFEDGDVLLFGGGEDISPTIYNQAPSQYCHASSQLSRRDTFEMFMYKKALENKIPMIGVCRGAQLICAASGGTLIQHVNGHGKAHTMTTKEGTVLDISSVHHQMMDPVGTKHELIAWATEALSNVYITEKERLLKIEVEPEIVYFHDVKGLAIQWHPEFMSSEDEAVIYVKKLIKSLFKE